MQRTKFLSTAAACFWGINLLLCCFFCPSAQGASLIIKGAGRVFNLSVNGVLQTLYPVNSVYITKIPEPTLVLKIEFFNLPPIEQSLYVHSDIDYSYEIVLEGENSYLQYKQEQKSNARRKKMTVDGLTQIEFGVARTDSSFYVPAPLPGSKIGLKVTSIDSSKQRTMAKMIDEKKIIDLFRAKRVHRPNTPIAQAAYQQAVKEIITERFDSKRLQYIKKTLSAHSYTIEQAIGLLVLLNFERNRLDCAKFAYHFVENYQEANRLYDLLELDKSVDDLKNYLDSF